MEQFILPEGYHSPLTIRETEVAIKEVKDHFERALAKSLHLTRVSAPLFVKPESGLIISTEPNVRFLLESGNRTMLLWRSYTLSPSGNDML